jgi:hypothetical protein
LDVKGSTGSTGTLMGKQARTKRLTKIMCDLDYSNPTVAVAGQMEEEEDLFLVHLYL